MSRVPRTAEAATTKGVVPVHRRRARFGIAGLSAAAVIVLAGCAGGAIAQDAPQSSGKSFVSGTSATTVYHVGDRPVAPDITGRSLTGGRIRLASYRGSVVVVNFWGSWCSPCRQEAPALGALAARLRHRGVRFLGIDIRDNTASAVAFMRTFRIRYPSINDPGDQIALDFRGTVPPVGIPTTLVIDRSGRIAARVVGGVTYAGLYSLIISVLGKGGGGG